MAKRKKSTTQPTSSDANNEQLARVACAIYERIAESTGSKNVLWADIFIEMGRLTAARNLIQLLTAMEPRQRDKAQSIIGDVGSDSYAELAYVFGVSESTIVNDWIPAGAPLEAI